MKTKKFIYVAKGISNIVVQLAFTPDDKSLYIANADDRVGYVSTPTERHERYLFH